MKTRLNYHTKLQRVVGPGAKMSTEDWKHSARSLIFLRWKLAQPFFTDKDQKKAEAFTKETVFFAFITSKFNDLVGPNMVFVNSENYSWLSQSSGASTNTKFKPDGFVTHVGMYRKSKRESPKQRGTDFRFGTADEKLYDCVILFECKLKISMVAFGQVIVYLENLSPTATAFAVLFDCHSFWLIESHKDEVVKVEKSQWVTKGSKEYLKNFIVKNTSPWVERLTNACSLLNVAVVEGNAFLGRGSIGCVFKVTRNGEALALKLVERDSARYLYDQEEAMRNVQSTGLTICPIGEICEILVDGVAEAAALLLSPVGTPFPPSKTQTQVQHLFKLLWQLHTEGFAHGNPRVSNVIVSEKKLLWIGLVTARKATNALKVSDANILVRSFLCLRHDTEVDPGLVQLIRNYGASSTLENFKKLANEVWAFNTQ